MGTSIYRNFFMKLIINIYIKKMRRILVNNKHKAHICYYKYKKHRRKNIYY